MSAVLSLLFQAARQIKPPKEYSLSWKAIEKIAEEVMVEQQRSQALIAPPLRASCIRGPFRGSNPSPYHRHIPSPISHLL